MKMFNDRKMALVYLNFSFITLCTFEWNGYRISRSHSLVGNSIWNVFALSIPLKFDGAINGKRKIWIIQRVRKTAFYSQMLENKLKGSNKNTPVTHFLKFLEICWFFSKGMPFNWNSMPQFVAQIIVTESFESCSNSTDIKKYNQ